MGNNTCNLFGCGRLRFWKDFYINVGKVKEKRTREVLDLLNESLGALIFDTDKEGKIVRKCQLCETGSLSLKISFLDTVL